MEKLSALWTKYFSSINAIIRASLGLGVVALFVAYYVISYYSFGGNALPLLQRLEEQAYDIRLRATMPEKIDPRVVIIDVDEKTLAAEGRWPLSRDRWVLLLQQLFDNY
ncbi:MAG: CHASE2 domain-containing protein, partial [Burkholderiales bacterium]|nr:CHASE2 domain-containing protein [Burkholderiales bacterium]